VIFATRVPSLPAGRRLGGRRQIDYFRRLEAKYLTGVEGLPGLGTYRNIHAAFIQRSGSRWLGTILDLGRNCATILCTVTGYNTSGRLGFSLLCIPPLHPPRLPVWGFPPFTRGEGYLGIFAIGLRRIR